MTNVYDFTNTDGVPAEIADAVTKERTGINQELYRSIVEVVTGAPQALSLKQVMFVLYKKGVEVPAETTVRSYLNKAKRAGDIGKPSRQSYWTVESDAGEETEEADEAPEGVNTEAETAAPEAEAAGVEPEANEDEDDPLADL